MNKEKMQLGLLLPTVDSADDACVDRLADLLQAKAGIDSVHAIKRGTETPDRICIHYDPSVVSTGEVRDLAKRAGAQLDQRYGHWLSKLRSTHARRASAIESRLGRVDGVLEAVVSPDGAVRVEYDKRTTSESAIAKALNEWTGEAADVVGDHAGHKHDDEGHEAEHDHSGHDHAHGGIFGPRSELIFAVLCGVLLLVGWLIESFAHLNEWISLGCYIAAYLFGGYYTVTEAIEKIRAGKFEIDFLMIVAAAGAASLGAWAEGALLLFLFSIGHALEGYAMGKAKRAIEALSELAPRTARVRRDSTETEVPVEELVVGDVVVIKPDERVPADGFVIAGESSINQAPITGESVPVDKRPVDDVDAAAADPESLSAEYRAFAGTINQSGSIEIQVTKTASENTLARVVTMVSEAETRVSPTQKFTKKFERYFVPSVITGVVLLMFAPLVIDESFSDSFYRAMAVLVAASPCALAIATPSAVLSGVARAARGGILVKGGGPLESLGSLDAIAFDKTGTLTEGEPKVTDVRTTEGVDESELLRFAIAVEDLSKHPLAKAVVRDGRKKLEGGESGEPTALAAGFIPEATDLKSITGRGIQATVEGELVHIGKDDLFAEVDGPPLPDSVRTIVESLEKHGRTTMIVRRGDRYLGVIGLMDTPREASKRTIAQLRQLGIQRMIMISGDNQQVADAVANEVGLDEARGDLMPDDKVTEIKKLQSEGGVAMVGDGVNDAPAMASASVGIAMGAAGSDVALETADVALMADNLDHLPLAIGLSRATRRIIRQNLWMSLGMVAFLVPATILGLNIGPAVALHEGSTLVVVFNALRLLAYRSISTNYE
ncbi:heavy metal translocating P-type ATPase [Stieleria sp. ICT_E10.1]|uniref:P-type Zn(2+) transporter n=1 Tax=Stieleria magnilauensis TaxID=2527963 RepID=A0ABX5XVJ4_9BACT|nr:heavy metal translocating P-type ATPase [Stieleria sedimenti]MCS7466360.1 heavy metal translocating P-type ATPase [Stieleria sedimenti]QDV85311.1 putative cadmium-transporting ATPase [Planctomycetes bacterium TBK1r]